MDLKEFKEFCKKELACLYFYSKQLTEKCELTILPFNYLLDWSLLERSSLDLKDSVIIFD
jgi:peroxiredoxin